MTWQHREYGIFAANKYMFFRPGRGKISVSSVARESERVRETGQGLFFSAVTSGLLNKEEQAKRRARGILEAFLDLVWWKYWGGRALSHGASEACSNIMRASRLSRSEPKVILKHATCSMRSRGLVCNTSKTIARTRSQNCTLWPRCHHAVDTALGNSRSPLSFHPNRPRKGLSRKVCGPEHSGNSRHGKTLILTVSTNITPCSPRLVWIILP